MIVAATTPSLRSRLARIAAKLAVDVCAGAGGDRPDPSAALRRLKAVLEIANPRSRYAPAVFGAVLAVVLALAWAEFDRRGTASEAQVFHLPGAVTAPVPAPKPLPYAPPR